MTTEATPTDPLTRIQAAYEDCEQALPDCLVAMEASRLADLAAAPGRPLPAVYQGTERTGRWAERQFRARIDALQSALAAFADSRAHRRLEVFEDERLLVQR